MENEVDIPVLVHQAKKGNPEAFGKLYDQFLDAIYRFVYFRVGSCEDAEDITEFIFMNAFMHINSYKEDGAPFQAWLYKIARNKIIDHYRTRKPRTSLDEAINTADTKVSVEDAVERKITFESVKQTLTKLPPAYQEIIILKFIEEKENEEISSMLDKPVAHIRVLQNRALQKLRQLMRHE